MTDFFIPFVIGASIMLFAQIIGILLKHFYQEGFKHGKKAPEDLTWEQAWRGEKGNKK